MKDEVLNVNDEEYMGLKEHLGLKDFELSYLDQIRNKSKKNHLDFDEFTEFN